MAGYSGTPLLRKLGIKPDDLVLLRNAPDEYEKWLGPLPAGAKLLSSSRAKVRMVHLFTRSRKQLASQLPALLKRIESDGAIWVSWPKRASKVETDVTEDVVRALALPLGLVDIKVCAVSEVWSALKLVIRKRLRQVDG